MSPDKGQQPSADCHCMFCTLDRLAKRDGEPAAPFAQSLIEEALGGGDEKEATDAEEVR